MIIDMLLEYDTRGLKNKNPHRYIIYQQIEDVYTFSSEREDIH